MAPPEISVTKSRADCDLTQQMVGVIKASSPGMKSMSADMFLDLLTMSAPSGEERKLGAAARGRARWAMPPPLQRSTAGCARACSAEAAASESSGLSVGGCPGRAMVLVRLVGPYPVYTRTSGPSDRGSEERSLRGCIYA